MRLFICEKPSLAEALANNLGKPVRKDGSFYVGNDVVTPLRGHIMRLYNADEYDPALKKWAYDTLPIVPSPFKKKVSGGSGYSEIYNRVKGLLKEATEVVNVGDPDREGQYLVDEVLEALKCKLPAKRLFINALDDTSIKRALASMEDNNSKANHNRYMAARGRAEADWIIGINATRKFSLDSGNTLHIGRVKMPTLALVYRRNEEIDNFKPKDFYGINAFFRTDSSMPFPSHWVIPEDLLDSENHLLDIVPARACEQKCKGKSGTVKSVIRKKGRSNPPLPYSLSTLQKDAGPKLSFSPSKVLEVAQSLYEKKLTTYPRSDSNYLPESQLEDASTIIANLKLTGSEELKALADNADSSIKGLAFNTKKVEAHHALIPTLEQCDMGKLSADEQKLYLLLAKRYLLQFYPAQEFESCEVVIDCEGETFKATGKVVLKEGWKGATGSEVDRDDDNAEDEEERKLPDLKEGDSLTMSSLEISKKVTKAPARFTQSSLIGALTSAHKFVKDKSLADKVKDVKGLGTEATRATMISDLLKSGELREEGKKKELFVSDSVKELIPFLPDNLTYPDMTACMELDLDRIEKGTLALDEFVAFQAQFVKELMAVETKFSKPVRKGDDYPECPVCHEGKLFPREGKFGKFWSCSNYKNGCKAAFDDLKGKPAIEKCPVCGKGFLRRKSGKDGGYFWSCSEYANGCKASFTDNKGKPVLVKCPDCGKGYLKKWTGKKGDYYQCSDCRKYFDVLKNGLPAVK